MNTVKAPYFNEKYQQWGVEFHSDDGHFAGDNIDWCSSEQAAKISFERRIKMGYAVIEDAPEAAEVVSTENKIDEKNKIGDTVSVPYRWPLPANYTGTIEAVEIFYGKKFYTVAFAGLNPKTCGFGLDPDGKGRFKMTADTFRKQ